eukprot:6491674-Amphidinium_carterae.4
MSSYLVDLLSAFSKQRNTSAIERRVKEKLQHVPKPISREDLARARTRSLLSPTSSVPASWQLRAVAKHRDQFFDAVFCFNVGGSLQWKKFCLAKCQPMLVVWMPLEPLDMSLLGNSSLGGSCSMDSNQHPLMGWSYDADKFEISDPWTLDDFMDVAVVMVCEHLGHGMLLTSHTMLGLEQVLPTERVSATASASKRPTMKKQTTEQAASSSSGVGTGFATSYLVELEETGSSKSHDSENTDNETEGSASDMTDAEGVTSRAHIYEALEADRLQWSDAVAESHCWFHYGVAGGEWQMNRTGRNTYGPRVTAKKGSVAQKFLTHFGLSCSAAFEYNKYGEGIAHELAKLWQYKVSSFIICWRRASEPPDFPWSTYESFEIPASIELTDSLLAPASLNRKRAILEMKPKR